jgi:hypothetical protein
LLAKQGDSKVMRVGFEPRAAGWTYVTISQTVNELMIADDVEI